MEKVHGERAVDRARLEAAEAQVASLSDAKSVMAAQLSHLAHQLRLKTVEAAAAPDLRAENAGLKERVVALADEAGRLAELVVELDHPREREHAAIRADYEVVPAEERKRIADLEARFGWLGVPVRGQDEGEPGG
jgi:hypothetical protein